MGEVEWGGVGKGKHKDEGQWADLWADYALWKALTSHSTRRVQQRQDKPPPLQPQANPQGQAAVHSLCKRTVSHLCLLYVVLSIHTITAEATQHTLVRGVTGKPLAFAGHVALHPKDRHITA